MRKISKNTRILLITGVIILMVMSGCSITAERHFERQVSPYSICWQDDEHFLVYCSIKQYYYTPNFLAEDDIHYDWVGGEIWRINATNGDCELLFQNKEGLLFTDPVSDGRLSMNGNNIYWCNRISSYLFDESLIDYKRIDSLILPTELNEEEILITDLHGCVKKYNIDLSESEEIYSYNTDIRWMYYNQSNNLLLINNRTVIELGNNNNSKILFNEGDIIEDYIVSSIYLNTPEYGQIFNDLITVDVYLTDTITRAAAYKKIQVLLDDVTQKSVYNNLRGIFNPSKTLVVEFSEYVFQIKDTLDNDILEVDLLNYN